MSAPVRARCSLVIAALSSLSMTQSAAAQIAVDRFRGSLPGEPFSQVAAPKYQVGCPLPTRAPHSCRTRASALACAPSATDALGMFELRLGLEAAAAQQIFVPDVSPHVELSAPISVERDAVLAALRPPRLARRRRPAERRIVGRARAARRIDSAPITSSPAGRPTSFATIRRTRISGTPSTARATTPRRTASRAARCARCASCAICSAAASSPTCSRARWIGAVGGYGRVHWRRSPSDSAGFGVQLELTAPTWT